MSWDPLVLSFQVALIATGLAGIIGVGLAGLVARARFRGRDLLDALITAPMVLPPTVLGYYLPTSLCVSRTTWWMETHATRRIARALSGLRRALWVILRRPSGPGCGATRPLAAVCA